MRRPLPRIALVLALVALAFGRVSAQQPILTPGATFQILETYLDSLRQQAGIPGLSAAVLQDGAPVWEHGFGYQNVAQHLPATPDTPYVVGDIAQTFAATLLLQCVEQRRVDLDAPLSRYGLSEPDPAATLRGLLSHAAPADAKTPFLYSPARFDKLTALMEWCAPQPYRKSIAHRLLERLAMIDSAPGTDWKDPTLVLPEGLFTDDDVAHYRTVLDHLAVPYKVDARGRVTITTLDPQGPTAAGGLVSTVRDLEKFDEAIDTSDLLLLDDTRAAAWTPAADGSPMGLGWFVQEYRGERVVWHFGYVPNAYSSLIVKIPGRQLTFILLANSDGLSASADLAAGDLTKSVFAQVFLRLAIRSS